MREVASSDGAGVYEQTFVRDKKIDHLHAVWKTFPDATEYKTKDLFSRHPDPKLADWWQFESRTDDLIAFANAGKYNPLRYEDQILSNPLVKAALMIGVQRPCAALLVEMAEDIPSDTESAAYQDLLEKVWVTVEDANREAPKHAFVAKDMILLASNDKPFERAGKGTVIRGRTLKKYEEETDGLYRKKGMGMEKTYGHPAV